MVKYDTKKLNNRCKKLGINIYSNGKLKTVSLRRKQCLISMIKLTKKELNKPLPKPKKNIVSKTRTRTISGGGGGSLEKKLKKQINDIFKKINKLKKQIK